MLGALVLRMMVPGMLAGVWEIALKVIEEYMLEKQKLKLMMMRSEPGFWEPEIANSKQRLGA